MSEFGKGVHWGMGFHLATKRRREAIECPKCGETLPKRLKYPIRFCAYCGTKLEVKP